MLRASHFNPDANHGGPYNGDQPIIVDSALGSEDGSLTDEDDPDDEMQAISDGSDSDSEDTSSDDLAKESEEDVELHIR